MQGGDIMFYFDFNKSSWGIEAKSKSSKLDYSKRSIRDYLIKNFNLGSIELNNAIIKNFFLPVLEDKQPKGFVHCPQNIFNL